MSNTKTNWQHLITINNNLKLVMIKELLTESNIGFVEMNKTDSSYPLLFSEIDIFVNGEQLIEAKLLLIENQID